MKSYHFKSFISAVFALFIGTQAHAEQWYQVELVVFEQLNSYSVEQWPNTSIADANLTPSSSNSYIQPAKTAYLNNIASSLARSPNYRVHYHKAWQQPMLSRGRSQAVSVTSDNGLIAGTIQLHLATYIHTKLDLWLIENQSNPSSWSDSSPQGVDIQAPRNPNLQESRRIRSKKVYYFDHPKLGAILEVVPVSTPAAGQEDIDKLESFSLPSEAAPTASQ